MNDPLTVLSAVLMPLVALFSVFWMVFTTRKLNRKLSEYEPMIDSIGQLLRYEEDENGQPLLDARLGKMIQAFSSGVAKSLQMSFLGQQSGVTRMDKGLKGAITKDIVDEQIPILGLIDDVLGTNTKKYVTKHPEALGQLAQLASPFIQKFRQQRNNGPGQGGQGGIGEIR